ncbi:hypothetical protein J437_LFUL015694 [Ladona fulva]|uniref:Uncharacterized protein n=1 Tax=Ladona fulva TaxID=123851 RepID=A0A8K0KMC4_LADFU|nr:hypothetical protein J437_LFUL015694 [Ladona fulva]
MTDHLEGDTALELEYLLILATDQLEGLGSADRLTTCHTDSGPSNSCFISFLLPPQSHYEALNTLFILNTHHSKDTLILHNMFKSWLTHFARLTIYIAFHINQSLYPICSPIKSDVGKLQQWKEFLGSFSLCSCTLL